MLGPFVVPEWRCAMANRYGYRHTLERRRWAMALLSQSLPCTVCGKTVTAVMDWHLDHTDDGRGYLGVAHAKCNTRKGAIKGNKMRAERGIRRWKL